LTTVSISCINEPSDIFMRDMPAVKIV
jgi:hypothetical protein